MSTLCVHGCWATVRARRFAHACVHARGAAVAVRGPTPVALHVCSSLPEPGSSAAADAAHGCSWCGRAEQGGRRNEHAGAADGQAVAVAGAGAAILGRPTPHSRGTTAPSRGACCWQLMGSARPAARCRLRSEEAMWCDNASTGGRLCVVPPPPRAVRSRAAKLDPGAWPEKSIRVVWCRHLRRAGSHCSLPKKTGGCAAASSSQSSD